MEKIHMRIENKSNEAKLLNFHLPFHRKTKKKQWRAKAKQNHLNLLLNVCLIIKFAQEYNLKQNCILLTLPETQGYNKIRRCHDVDIWCWTTFKTCQFMNVDVHKLDDNWCWRQTGKLKVGNGIQIKFIIFFFIWEKKESWMKF